uniref:DUF19 domain-containing protein n=1 Tax=Anopheles merus TaxID=30066 RepID=A0A182V2D9_ANOME
MRPHIKMQHHTAMMLRIIVFGYIFSTTFCEPGNTLAAFPEPVCGQISQMLDGCFHNVTPNATAELLHTVQIPETIEQINSRCRLFNRGMDCVERYLDVCVDAKERFIIDSEVYGAKRLYQFLCRDRAFQQEFLWHKECFQLVHRDLDSCSKRFVSILKEEIAKTTKQSLNEQYMHFCCARYAYENCVYISARYKCKPDSAVFLRRIAKLLSSDKHFLNCDKIETELGDNFLATVSVGSSCGIRSLMTVSL